VNQLPNPKGSDSDPKFIKGHGRFFMLEIDRRKKLPLTEADKPEFDSF
jgi:hypothetical protein